MKQMLWKKGLRLLCFLGAMMLLPHGAWGQGVWTYDEGSGTFSCVISEGEVTINSTLHSETVDGFTKNGNISHILLNGGILKLDGVHGLPSVEATAGTLQVNGYGNAPTSIVTNLTVKGDVTIQGPEENQHIGSVAENMVIASGNVTLKDLGISMDKTIRHQGGNLTLSSVRFYTDEYHPTLADYLILQTGGELLFSNNVKTDKSCEQFVRTEGGILSLEGENFSDFGLTGFVVAKEGTLNIKNGTCYGSFLAEEGGTLNIENCTFYGLHSKGGNVVINGGIFNPGNHSINGQQINKPIVIEGGSLTITDGDFTAFNDGQKTACVQILAKADVALSGGVFKNRAFYFDPSVSLIPGDLLENGYGYFTLTQALQPDVQYKSDDIQYSNCIQVKPLNSGESASTGREAALNANVGPEGTDVKVIGEQAPYDYEINTPEGLLWLMTAVNGYWSEHHEVELPSTDYYKISKASKVYLTADLDMSGYEWVPISVFSSSLLDGQNHRIYNLSVNQACATFIAQLGLGNSPILANLVVSGTFNSKDTKYNRALNPGSSGLVCNNGGYIVNCGVEQSVLTTDFTDPSAVRCAGLVAMNNKVIQNSYFTGSIRMEETYTKPKWEGTDVVGGYIRAGGVAATCDSGSSIQNTYSLLDGGEISHGVAAGGFTDQSDVKITNTVGELPEGAEADCFHAEEAGAALDKLNAGVDAHEAIEGETPWKEWIIKEDRNGGFPIPGEKNKPSVIDYPFTLKAEGPGTFEGYYVTGEGEDGKQTFQADTTIIFTNGRTFHLTPKPDKGATLVDVVRVMTIEEEGVEKLDSIPQEKITANEEYKLLAQEAYELVARFRLDTLYIENDTTVLGGSEEITSVDKVEISAPGTDEKPAVVEIGNVTVSPKGEEGGGAPEAKTTITEEANVILKLSGTNDLGTLTNNGSVTIEKGDGTKEVALTAKVVNNGTLVDNTGLITEVLDGKEAPLLSITNGTSEGSEITEGGTATLSATASVPEGAAVTFEWQRRSGEAAWTTVGTASYPQARMMTRAAGLRSEAKTGVDSYTDNRQETLPSEGVYDYRCLITHTVAGTETEAAPVSTTLSVYTTVTVTAEEQPDPDPDPEQPEEQPDPVTYTVTLPSVTGVTTDPEAGAHEVEEGGNFLFTLTLDEGYSQSEPVVEADGKTLEPDARGCYTVKNIRSDVKVSITGIVPDQPTANEAIGLPLQVRAGDGVLKIYSETREVARIVTFDGRLHKTLTVLGDVTETDLPEGYYMVLIKGKVFKFVNRAGL